MPINENMVQDIVQEVLAKTNPSLPFPAPQADDEEDVIMLH